MTNKEKLLKELTTEQLADMICGGTQHDMLDRFCENASDKDCKYPDILGCKTHTIAWLDEEVKEEPQEET